MELREWQCSFCEDPCYLKIRKDDGMPTTCVFGLGKQYKCRWDEVEGEIK